MQKDLIPEVLQGAIHLLAMCDLVLWWKRGGLALSIASSVVDGIVYSMQLDHVQFFGDRFVLLKQCSVYKTVPISLNANHRLFVMEI